MSIGMALPSCAMGSLRGLDERHARSAIGRSGRTGAARPAEQGETTADGPGGHAQSKQGLALESYSPSRLALTQELLKQAAAAVFMELAAPDRTQPGQSLDRQV